jgi:hypothetical protein
VIHDFVLYLRLIARKWVLWLFFLLDLAALIAQIAVPGFQLPQTAFLLLTVVGLLWAGFQVHSDLARQLPTPPRYSPPPFELLPLSFTLYLGMQIPTINVWLYAVNHEGKELDLRSANVTTFALSGGPTLANIAISSHSILPPRSSRELLCRRPLLDAEVRAVRSSQHNIRANATFSATAEGFVGRRAKPQEAINRSMNGWIEGL